MSQPERISEILKRKEYRHLNSPNLKPTPDITEPPPPMSRDELDEAKMIFDYEQALEAQKSKRGY